MKLLEGGDRGLLAWIVAPLLALVVIVVLVIALPSTECDWHATRESTLGQSLLGFAGLVALASLLGGAYRWLKVRRSRGGRGFSALDLLMAAAVLLSAADLVFLRLITFLFLLPVLAGTFVAVASLIRVVRDGGDADAAGFSLPVYLLGIGLYLSPSIVAVGILVQNGGFCGD